MLPLPPLPTDEWDDHLDHVQNDMKGAPLNVHKLMAHNPDLLAAWWPLRTHAVQGGTLGNRLGELVILRVAVNLGAWYEWASHVDRSLKVGMSLDEINRVLVRDTASWPRADSALLRAVDQLFASNRLSSDMQTELNACFTDQQVLDLFAIQGMYMILGNMIGSFDPDLDTDVAARVAPHITREAFETAARTFAAQGQP